MDLHEIVSKIKQVHKELDKTPTILEFIYHTDVSKRQIHKHGWNKLVKMAGLEPNANSHQVEAKEIYKYKPKILIFDIETSTMLAHIFNPRTEYVGQKQIVQDVSVLSVAAKWWKEKKVFYKDTFKNKNKRDDLEVCKFIHELIEEADILVGHNIDRFDIKKLNGRFIKHGLKPLPKPQTVDTLKLARKYFSFSYNNLGYLAQYLECAPKSDHAKFSGITLWIEYLNGNKEAQKEMKDYNIQDILTNEEIFEKLLPWNEQLNFQTYYGKWVCTCGHDKYYKHGLSRNKQNVFQRYRCENCQKVITGKFSMIDKEEKKGFFK